MVLARLELAAILRVDIVLAVGVLAFAVVPGERAVREVCVSLLRCAGMGRV